MSDGFHRRAVRRAQMEEKIRELSANPEYFAYWVKLWAEREGCDLSFVAETMGTTKQVVAQLMLCLAPERGRIRYDLWKMANFFGVSPLELARIFYLIPPGAIMTNRHGNRRMRGR